MSYNLWTESRHNIHRWGAIGAVFGSWENDRAKIYRAKYQIPSEWGTAVNVQAMVFGNLGNTSATGVCFTRSPTSGENIFYGEYLINAQGEDVVAGIRTPHSIDLMAQEMPQSYKELQEVRVILENHFKDMQDIEFTIQESKLYMLQTRNGKRTGALPEWIICHPPLLHAYRHGSRAHSVRNG